MTEKGKGVQPAKISLLLLLFMSTPLLAQTLEACIEESMKTAEPTMTLGELKSECELLINPDYQKETVAFKRLAMERRTEWNPFVITPHKQNYILPATYMTDPNNEPYEFLNEDGLDQREVKMQMSFKVPLTDRDLLVTGDSLHFGFTLQAYWQLYNHESSAPFRETNYQPEFFYTLPLHLNDKQHAAAFRFGAEHQSNGESQPFSRSWNRIYAQVLYARNNYLLGFRPWYRLPEKEKDEPLDPSGDDNPDIDDYMGYFELTGVVEHRKFEFSMLLRNNLRSDNHGAVEVGMSFPFFNRLRGYVQYFNGYGESLIDYDHRIERFGFGILLTDLL